MSFKKYLGVALAATMTLSMASCAFAEEGVHGLYEDPANTQVTDETVGRRTSSASSPQHFRIH